MCTVRNCQKTCVFPLLPFPSLRRLPSFVANSFCRKTTLTKHIKKNHPQHAHNPEKVSAACFDESEDEFAHEGASASSSMPQSPTENGVYMEDDSRALPTPAPLAAYGSYYPAAPATPDMRSRRQLHHETSPGAWSEPGYGGYPDPRVLQTPMSRSVSHETSQQHQQYLTPPRARYQRVTRQRRGPPARYAEEDVEGMYEHRAEDDDEYVEDGQQLSRSIGRGRRGGYDRDAFSPSEHEHQQAPVSRRIDYPTPSPQQQQEHFSPYQQYPAQEQPQRAMYGTPQAEYPPTPAPTSYAMAPSYTAPLPQIYTYESQEPVYFSAPPLRRASSVGALDSLMPPPASFSSPSPQLSHAEPSSSSSSPSRPLGLGLSLHSSSFAVSSGHERRLSELHRSSPSRPSFTFDELDSVPLPSPTSNGSFQFPGTARRGSTFGFPRLPESLSQGTGPAGQRGSFSTMTSTILKQMEDEQYRQLHQQQLASGMVVAEAY